jgi:hypothetical protein
VFNPNTGYFLIKTPYIDTIAEEIEEYWILCQGYKMFGIDGYDRIGYFTDRNKAIKALSYFVKGKKKKK